MKKVPRTSFCIFCGSSNIEEVRLRRDSSMSPKSISIKIVTVALTKTGSIGSNMSLTSESYYCKTCQKIDVFSNNPPIRVEIPQESMKNLVLLFPDSLLRLFNSIGMLDNEIKKSILSLTTRMKQVIKKYQETGENPCKNGKKGFKSKMCVKGKKIEVYALVENEGKITSVRVMYDGGRSFCQ